MLGILTGAASVAFIKSLEGVSSFFAKIKTPVYVHTALGGLLIGAIGLFAPHVLGDSYETLDKALHGGLLWQTMLLLAFVKLAATSLSLGSGGSGGAFGPSLFLGAMLGGMFGQLVHSFYPDATAPSGAYALVGMGAVVAATTHAPIAAILIIFEMTNDYNIILPLMISCIIATLLSTRLEKESIFTIKLIKRGVDLRKGRDVNVLKSIKVKDVMNTDIETVPAGMPFKNLMRLMIESPRPEFFVTSPQNDFLGVITLTQVREAIDEQDELNDLLVAHDLMKPDVPCVYPTNTLNHAMKIFGKEDVDILPIISKSGPPTPIGEIRRKDVIEAYNREIARLDVTAELVGSMKSLDEEHDVDFVDGYMLSEVNAPSEFCGRSLRALNLRARYNIQIILIKRAGSSGREHSIVPQPSERLREEDKIVVVGPRKQIQMLKNL